MKFMIIITMIMMMAAMIMNGGEDSDDKKGHDCGRGGSGQVKHPRDSEENRA
jgi:hypothetical protein